MQRSHWYERVHFCSFSWFRFCCCVFEHYNYFIVDLFKQKEHSCWNYFTKNNWNDQKKKQYKTNFECLSTLYGHHLNLKDIINRFRVRKRFYESRFLHVKSKYLCRNHSIVTWVLRILNSQYFQWSTSADAGYSSI